MFLSHTMVRGRSCGRSRQCHWERSFPTFYRSSHPQAHYREDNSTERQSDLSCPARARRSSRVPRSAFASNTISFRKFRACKVPPNFSVMVLRLPAMNPLMASPLSTRPSTMDSTKLRLCKVFPSHHIFASSSMLFSFITVRSMGKLVSGLGEVRVRYGCGCYL